MANKLFVNSIEGLTTETDFDIYFAPKNGMRANEINIGRAGKRLKKELNIVQDMLSILVNRPIRQFDIDTVYQYGELVQTHDIAGDTDFVKFWQSQADSNIAIHPEWDENNSKAFWKEFEPFGNYESEEMSGDYKNDVKFGYQMHNSGYFTIGERMGRNVAIDRDEITARTFDVDTNTVHPSILRMQANGGMLTIHGNLWEVESERYRVSTFTDDGRFILGNKETIHTDTDPHPFDNCYKFECWGDALITQDLRVGGWVTFDKGFDRLPFLTIQDGSDASLTDRLHIAPNPGNSEIEINALSAISDEGKTLHLQNHVSQTGDVMINSSENLVHIKKNGFIGIKKLDPIYAVHAKGSLVSDDGSNGSFRIINEDSKLILNTCGEQEFYLNCYDAEDAPKDLHIQNAGGDTIFNCVNSMIHFTSDGKVGIGVMNPECALDVAGNAYISNNISANSAVIANQWKTLTIESGLDETDEYRLSTGAFDGTETRLFLQDNPLSDLVINGTSLACIAKEAPVHITKDGFMGVGRLDPEYKVDVAGGARYTDKVVIEDMAPSDVAFETGGIVKADYFDGNFDISKLTGSIPEADHALEADESKVNSSEVGTNAVRCKADDVYTTATIMAVGGIEEVTLALDNTLPIAGVVVDELDTAGRLNNYASSDDTDPYIVTSGRANVKVNGNVVKGDYIVVDTNGYGKAGTPVTGLDVVGIALEDFTGVSGTVLILIR